MEVSTRLFFAGGAYEVTLDGSGVVQATKQYYAFGGTMVAMDDGTELVYFASDHLSSTSLVMDDAGAILSAQRYMPFGQVRADVSFAMTDYTDLGYTSQRPACHRW